MNLLKSYKKAYKALNKVTPLKEDCGLLCNKLCCTGTDKSGMLLFPYEEELYSDVDRNFFNIIDSNIILSNNYKIKLFVCNGQCNRNIRPLACRIFPLTPYWNEEDTLDVRLDLRGISTCPLIYDAQKHVLDKKFYEKVFKALNNLVEYEIVALFVDELTQQYNDLKKFYE